MQHAGDASPCGPYHRSSVIFCIACMYHQRFSRFSGQRYLCRKNSPLHFAGRVVIVVIQSALPNCHSSAAYGLANARNITRRVEGRRLVRMHAGRPADETRIVGGDFLGEIVCIENRTDADDAPGALRAGALYYRVAVAVERVVAEVRVAVEEREPVVVWRGHLRSIQRRIGPAT